MAAVNYRGPSPLDAKYISDGYNKFLDKRWISGDPAGNMLRLRPAEERSMRFC